MVLGLFTARNPDQSQVKNRTTFHFYNCVWVKDSEDFPYAVGTEFDEIVVDMHECLLLVYVKERPAPAVHRFGAVAESSPSKRRRREASPSPEVAAEKKNTVKAMPGLEAASLEFVAAVHELADRRVNDPDGNEHVGGQPKIDEHDVKMMKRRAEVDPLLECQDRCDARRAEFTSGMRYCPNQTGCLKCHTFKSKAWTLSIKHKWEQFRRYLCQECADAAKE